MLKSLTLLLLLNGSAYAQYGGPPMWDRNYQDWGPQEQRRRLPPRDYDPYDRGPERMFPRPDRSLSPEEYDRRAFCAMHPRECGR